MASPDSRAHRARRQAETPLSVLCRFPEPALLLLVSLLVTTTLAAIGKYGSGYIDEWILHLSSLVVSFAVIRLCFAMMFKRLPDTPVDWYDVWLGAILTTIFFEIGKLAIGFYIGKRGLQSTYGAAA
jgi:membrane protein